MKKWLEYQFKTQVKNFDWDNLVWKVENLAEPLGAAFQDIRRKSNVHTM